MSMSDTPQALTLFDGPIVDAGTHGTITERFERFDRLNPNVYRLVVMLARQSIAAGATRISMKQIFENLRASYRIARVSNEPWKINNDFSALYSRKLVEQYPDLRPYFELRKRIAA